MTIDITQADRDFAAEIFQAFNPDVPGSGLGVIDGQYDDHPVVKRAAAFLQASTEELRAENERLRRRATDRQYMLDAVVAMLGPKGLEVWRGWQADGVERVHISWGPDAANMTGEERAQANLDFKIAAQNAVPITDFDSSLRGKTVDLDPAGDQ